MSKFALRSRVESLFRRTTSGKPRARSRNRQQALAAALPCIEPLEGRVLMSNTWYVSPGGNDTANSGTSPASAFLTISKAAQSAQQYDTVVIESGTYRETVTPVNSHVTFEAAPGANVVISGTNLITNAFQGSGPTYDAANSVNMNGVDGHGADDNQVFVDGQMLNQAAWPNPGLNLSHPAVDMTGYQIGTNAASNETYIYDSSLPIEQAADYYRNATIHITPGAGWTSYTGTVQHSGTTTYQGQQQTWLQISVPWPRGSSEQITVNEPYYLTGAPINSLIGSGEWYLDGSNTLYLQDSTGDNPSNHRVEIKARDYAFNLSGISYTKISGITLFAAGIETDQNSQNTTIDSVNAYYVDHFMDLPNGGWNPSPDGIELQGSNSTLENSTIAYAAGDGVYIGNSISEPTNVTVTNNTIHDVDYSATDDAAVHINAAPGEMITSNYIYNTGRTGVNARGVGAVVENNTIHDFMLQTYDGGGIYTIGVQGNGTAGSGGNYSYNTIYNGRHVNSNPTYSWADVGGIMLDANNGNPTDSYMTVANNTIYNVDAALKANAQQSYDQIQNNYLGGRTYAIESGQAGAPSWDLSTSSCTGNVYTESTATALPPTSPINYSFNPYTFTDNNSVLGAPTGLTATSTASSVTLSWNPVIGASGYVVLREGPGQSTYSQVGPAILQNTTVFADTSVAAGATYSYEVAATQWQSAGPGQGTATSAVTATTAATTASAQFLRANDTTTHGTWSHMYGSDGYWVFGYANSNPAYAQVTPKLSDGTPAPTYTWTGPGTNLQQADGATGNALQVAPGSATQIAAADYNSALYTSFYFDINLTDGRMHQVALYMLDWDLQGRGQNVTVTDASSGATLDSRPNLSGFQHGVYFVWDLSGHVKITLNHQNQPGQNAVASGLFFDPPVSRVGIFSPGSPTSSFYLDSNGDHALQSPPDATVSYTSTSNDVPVTGDWAGQGHGKYAGVFNNGTWHLDSNENNVLFEQSDTVDNFGQSGDLPVVGDWNGDGRTKLGVWRPTDHSFSLDMNGNGSWDNSIDKWFQITDSGVLQLLNSGHSYTVVAGDWNGKGLSQLGFFDSSAGVWYLDNNEPTDSTHTFAAHTFGQAGDAPVVGSWNGGPADEIGVWRSSNGSFSLDTNDNYQWDNTGDTWFQGWQGPSTDKPVSI